MTIHDFVFLDANSRPWRVITESTGEIWLYKLTGNKNWITLMKLKPYDRKVRFDGKVDDKHAYLYEFGVPFKK